MKDINELIKFHEVIRELVHQEIPAQQLSILYRVARFSGITHREIGDELGMPQGTVSRNVAKLATKLVNRGQGAKHVDGYGLVENRIDYRIDTRRNAVYLTAKGEVVMAQILGAFNREGE